MKLLWLSACLALGLYSFWIIYSIRLRQNPKFISGNSSSLLIYPKGLVAKITFLSGIFGLLFLLLPVWLTYHDIPVSQWHHSIVGLIMIVGSSRSLLFWQHERKDRLLKLMKETKNGILYASADMSLEIETRYLIDFEKKYVLKSKLVGGGKSENNQSPKFEERTLDDTCLKKLMESYEKILDRSFLFSGNRSSSRAWRFHLLKSGNVFSSGAGQETPRGHLLELDTTLKKIFDSSCVL